jgi:hypothetical protein
VNGALEVDAKLNELKARAGAMGADEFAAAWDEFLTGVQHQL